MLLDGRKQLARPLPSFARTALSSDAGRLRIVFGSCVGATIAAVAPTWAELAERRAMSVEEGGFDLLLMLGDNH